MAYSSGTASSMNDLMSQLSTFCQANGWTQDQYTAESGGTHGKLSLHKGTVYVHFQWNSSIAASIAMYQSLGFISSGTNIWAHTDDSGNGPSTVPIATWDNPTYTGRYRLISEIGAGPYTSHAFFQGNGVEDYVHVVLEFAPYIYRHFGFGILEKSWDWTGGEYAYAHCQTYTPDNYFQDILLPSQGVASSTYANRFATVHAEGLPGEPVNSKWGTFAKFSALNSSWSDRAGEYQIRFLGGSPGGFIGNHFINMPSNAGDGFLPLNANAIFYRDLSPTPDNLYFMGFQPDVRSLNMKSFSPKDEVSVAGDTWVIFPAVRKQNTGDKNESENWGIAYKKIT